MNIKSKMQKSNDGMLKFNKQNILSIIFMAIVFIGSLGVGICLVLSEFLYPDIENLYACPTWYQVVLYIFLAVAIGGLIGCAFTKNRQNTSRLECNIGVALFCVGFILMFVLALVRSEAHILNIFICIGGAICSIGFFCGTASLIGRLKKNKTDVEISTGLTRSDNVLAKVKQILKQENISYSEIKKASSGFTNYVFLIDKKYVIKLTEDSDKKSSLRKEINLYKTFDFDFVPKLIACGEFENYQFLIISQIQGKRLYSIWHTLDNQTRKDIMFQIANILKCFHKVNAKLPKKDVIDEWEKYWQTQNDICIEHLKQLEIDSPEIEKALQENLKFLSDNKYCLVYNDAHFDNFIYDNGKLYLIDFDRVIYCPIDYELMIFKSMCDQPWKFANETDEEFTKKEDYENLPALLKEFYPEMFDFQYLTERLKFYQFHYYFQQAYSKKDRTWAENLIHEFILKG